MVSTVSLETAKKLKEAGFPQDTDKWYIPDYETREGIPTNLKYFLQDGYEGFISKYRFAAPTTDELLAELPFRLKDAEGEWHCLEMAKFPGIYRVKYQNIEVFDGPLPEALAQMWLWLKKERLLKDGK